MKRQHVLIALAIIFCVGVGAFYGGMQYDKKITADARTIARTQFGAGAKGQGGRGMMGGRGQNGGGFVAGEVLSKDDKSLTIKTPDGGSTIVYFSAELSVRKSESGNLSDVAAGEKIVINGKANSDGSFTADTIQISPEQTR